MTMNPSPLWHPFTQHGLQKQEIEVVKSSGAIIKRGDGREIIDAISSWWVVTHGHCHPTITNAVKDQADQLDQVIFAGFTHKPAQDLANNLLTFTGGYHDYVFLSDSGSTAVEVALKMAIGYWQHSNQDGSKQARTKILALEEAYHGDTFGTMSTGARGAFNAAYEPFLFDVIHTPVPLKGCEDEALSKLEAILRENGEDIAAFVFEPLVQGAGGMRIYAPEMLKAMCDMCQRYGILLIADEVMTGFGRTGTIFACQQAGVKPDLMALSKGLTGGFLPLGATLATRRIYEAFYSRDRSKMFFHSSSFTGNPLACTAANASLQIWQDEDVIAKLNAIQQSHTSSQGRFAQYDHVSNVRQCGTILAMDVAAKTNNESGYFASIGQEFYDFALNKGVLLRALGSVIYILPPYCISKEELNDIYEVIDDFLKC